jgi:hypothetical protein
VTQISLICARSMMKKGSSHSKLRRLRHLQVRHLGRERPLITKGVPELVSHQPPRGSVTRRGVISHYLLCVPAMVSQRRPPHGQSPQPGVNTITILRFISSFLSFLPPPPGTPRGSQMREGGRREGGGWEEAGHSLGNLDGFQSQRR